MPSTVSPPHSPKCHRGPLARGGCRATIVPFLVLLYWENLSHSWGKGNENQPRCSRRRLPGTAVNGGSNPAPGCGTSPKPPRFSRRAGLWVPPAATVRAATSPSFPHLCSMKDSGFSHLGCEDHPPASQVRVISICLKLSASLNLSEGRSL